MSHTSLQALIYSDHMAAIEAELNEINQALSEQEYAALEAKLKRIRETFRLKR